VTVAVGTGLPTHAHGHITVLRSRHAGSAQKLAPGGGGGVQSAGRTLEVTVGHNDDEGDGGVVVGEHPGSVTKA
jgi:hypothetical protein